jgi:rhodanese-related sulfurtransferase
MEDMTPQQAHDAWSAAQVTIVDVREQAEHDATRIPGVPLLPMSELMERMDELPEGPLVILCRSGRRSAQVADYLNATGTREAANLDGGIIGWANAGLPYEGEPPR